jgi:hypothetical protein
MITLLASLAGFISSIIPEFIKFFKDINDKKHELNILQCQIEYTKAYQGKSLEEINISRDLMEQASLYSTYRSENKFVEALNASVRPVLAYSFFLMYLSIKYLQYKALSHSNAILVEYLDVIWNVDDQAIFAGIISFYYGQRTFKNFWKSNM